MKKLSCFNIFASLFIALITSLISACSSNEATFSSRAGFKQYFAENPPSKEAATAQEQQLLARYRPRVYLAKGQTRFLDFYDDYIASGELYNKGDLVSNQVTTELLNQYRDSSTAEFRHIPHEKPTTPVVYGKVVNDTLEYQGRSWPFTFLSYNLVFAQSGVLQGLPGWQNWFLDSTGMNRDWHQLDHYVGLAVVLHQDKPIAVMLQQHNYQSTYVIDHKGEHGIPWPSDERIQVDVAKQSNELYLHSAKLKKHPGVSFSNADSIEFLKTGKNKPMMAGADVTHGEQEQEYKLKFLPANDAFYQFKGRLGAKRSLPGRDGPPGADYVTLPGLMPWANRLVTGFRVGSIAEEQGKITNLLDEENFLIRTEGLEAYRKGFVDVVFE